MQNHWLPYLQGSIILLLFQLGYSLLKNKSSFRLQRLFLLSGLFLSLTPFVWHWLPQWRPEQLITFSLPALDIQGEGSNALPGWNYLSLLPYLYFVGVTLSLLPAIGNLIRVGYWLWSGYWERKQGFTLVHTVGKKHGICSFGPFVFISAQTSVPQAFLLHEQTHIHKQHSVDKLLMQLVASLYWFLPTVYMLRRDLNLVHELEADAAVVQVYPTLAYATELSAYSLGVPGALLMNPLFKSKSQLLTRITMLNKTINPRNNKLALGLLFLAIMLGCSQAYVGSEADDAPRPNEVIIAEILESVDVMPEFPGGKEALLQYMLDKVKYTDRAKSDSAEGIVVVSFVVNNLGDIQKAEVLRTVHPDLDALSVKAVEAMPRWTPGQQDGKPVNMAFKLPFRFKLPKATEE